MKILFLSHRVPYPPNKGDKLRAYYIIDHLVKQGHHVDLLSFMDYAHEESDARELEQYCSSVAVVLRSPWRSLLRTAYYLGKNLPITLGHFYSSRFRRLVNKKLQLEKYDLIIVFSSSMAQYVAEYKGCPKILDLVDADSDKWLQYAKYAPWWKAVVYKLEGRRLRNYEQAIAEYFDVCTVVTQQEKDLIADIIPARKLRVVTNGFNLSPIKKPPPAKAPAPTLLFIGGMFYFAYIDGILRFYEESLPLIKQRFPNIKLYIVGANPAKSIRNIGKSKHVEVTGHVPEVEPYLEKTWVYIVPLRMAPGIQNKIIEAMAAQLPVVATPAAINGIPARHGKEVFVAGDSQKFAEAVIELLNNEKMRKQMGSAGRRFVEKHYNWSRNLSALDEIIKEISRGNPAFNRSEQPCRGHFFA